MLDAMHDEAEPMDQMQYAKFVEKGTGDADLTPPDGAMDIYVAYVKCSLEHHSTEDSAPSAMYDNDRWLSQAA